MIGGKEIRGEVGQMKGYCKGDEVDGIQQGMAQLQMGMDFKDFTFNDRARAGIQLVHYISRCQRLAWGDTTRQIEGGGGDAQKTFFFPYLLKYSS